MLRITFENDEKNKVKLKLEGRLVGPWVQELKLAVLRANLLHTDMEIDVGDLTFSDEEGEQVLMWLCRMGAKFRGDGLFSEYLCRRLAIPLRTRRARGRR